MPDYVPVDSVKVKFTDDASFGYTDASFDAVLYKPPFKSDQPKLTIQLRLRLQQINPYPYPWVLDFEKKLFWIRPWNGTDWANFINGAKAQANMWNNKFWLKPPPTFTDFDVTYPGFEKQSLRPYITCELEVDFNANKANAHKTIDVANLDTSKIVGPKNSGTFRSHALLFDSLDNTPVVHQIPDHTGKVNNMQHYTIAHEIGHALGLDHIGLLQKTALCQLAIGLDTAGFGIPETKGGTSSNYCYGGNQPKHVAENVMGYGASFSLDNARPWLRAISAMRERYEFWLPLMNVDAAYKLAGEWVRT